ncbi:hypothetical protein LIER_07273 [Lithospermum erythrorhizon]|uniref:Uncharacterized protein n=1 Tax=Lithospermum erythrorhizon TaxID=34254 RepID=A0AAV3P963_LITER
MTINKSQGQTLSYVGLYLKQPVFCHGQLYVALSRVKTGKDVKVLVNPHTCRDPGTEYIANVIYNEVLEKIRTDTQRWTARITITKEIPVPTCSTGSDLKLKRYVFTEGNQTTSSIFGDLINVYSHVL